MRGRVGGEAGGGMEVMHLSRWDALWWAALQQDFLFQAHLPAQRLLLKVLPQVCGAQQMVRAFINTLQPISKSSLNIPIFFNTD